MVIMTTMGGGRFETVGEARVAIVVVPLVSVFQSAKMWTVAPESRNWV